MSDDEKSGMRQAVQQITAVDPVVAIDLSAFGDSLARAAGAEKRAAAAAANVPSKIALIPVYGGLTPRGSFFGTSFSGIVAQLRRAASDSDVGAIVLDIDSPGGTVSGTMEAAQEIAATAAQKPVIAIANSLAASAAYWLGSQATEFVIAPSGDVGSIGVMILHQDLSGMLEQWGVKFTLIRSEQSPLKNEAHPFGPLSEEATAFLQKRANDAGGEFVKAVAGGRRVSQTKVREEFGQGRVYGAREALSRGMVDRIATLDDVIAGLAAKMTTRGRRRSALAFE